MPGATTNGNLPRATTNGNVPSATTSINFPRRVGSSNLPSPIGMADDITTMLNVFRQDAPVMNDEQHSEAAFLIYCYYFNWVYIDTAARADLDQLHSLWLAKKETEIPRPSPLLNRLTRSVAMTQLLAYNRDIPPYADSSLEAQEHAES